MKKASSLITLFLMAELHYGFAKINGIATARKFQGQSLLAFAATAPKVSGELSDTNIRYFGRWDFSNTTQYVSKWGGAYFRVKFTGTTVKVKVGNTSNFYAKIDNGSWTSYIGVTGTINLTPTPLASGTHTVSVAQGKDYDYVFNFQGLVLDAGATTAAPPVGTDLIEWIGDSITAGYTDSQADVSDYAWVCSEAMGTEHTQIAYPGICLTSGFTANPGMDVGYFKLLSPKSPSPPSWDFTKYTAKLVVINLGTNDNNHKVPAETFQSTMTTFLTNVRASFPDAEIFVIECFKGGIMSAPTIAAVNARHVDGDGKVIYVETTNWLTTSDYTDGLHPSVAGHIKVSHLLQPILSPYLSSATGSVKAAGKYQCIPCGSDCDKNRYETPGDCPVCHMKLVEAASVNFGSVDPSKICEYIQSHPGIILLDVRTKREFEGKADPDFGTLKNAINVPIQELEARIGELAAFKEKEIVVYCSHSRRSPQASYLLTQNGFKHVVNMAGGMSMLKGGECVK